MIKFIINAFTRLYLILIIIPILFIGACSSREKTNVSKPNIVLIVADDLGWHDVGYHDSEISTPNIDKLFNEGIELNKFYTYPTCSPTRASLLTGMYANRFGIEKPIAMNSKQVLPLDVVSLPKLFKENGYATAIMGKWHLGLRLENSPLHYGFDYAYGYLHGQIDQYSHRYKNGDRSWYRMNKFIDEKGHATDLITKEAKKYIVELRDKSKPFFIHIAYSVPHYPLQEKDKWVEPYKKSIKEKSRRLFAASVTHMDFEIGQIIKTLKEEKLRENTIIIFISDNGGQKSWTPKFEYDLKYGPYPILGDNSPLRGYKTMVYEGGIRVPGIINWKDKLSPKKIDQILNITDIFPTLAAAVGIKIPNDLLLDGNNMWEVISNNAEYGERGIYLQTNSHIAYIKNNWKLIHNAASPDSAEDELYNIKDDPYEKKNVIDQNPEVYKSLIKGIEKNYYQYE